MKEHLNIDGRSENKIIAQRVGINTAQESFKISLKKRNFLFSWDDDPVTLSQVLSDLHMCYAKVPTDLDSLRVIVRESCLIEYSNLKEKYRKPLPVSIFSDEQIFSCLVDAVTYELVKDRKKSNFSIFLQNGCELNDMSLHEYAAQSYPIDELSKKASNMLDELFIQKKVSVDLQEKIRQAVDKFWKNFNVVPSFR